MALTGGTGDVNPQWFKLKAIGTNAAAMNSDKVALPVQRLANKRKAMIMEALKVKYVVRDGSDKLKHIKVGVATIQLPSGSPDFSLGYILSGIHTKPVSLSGGVDAAPGGANGYIEDLTDGAGHGICIATDFLYPFIFTGTDTGVSIDIWILYRWKNVDLEEYSGILQSQSN